MAQFFHQHWLRPLCGLCEDPTESKSPEDKSTRRTNYIWKALDGNSELQERYAVEVRNKFQLLDQESATEMYARFINAINETAQASVEKVPPKKGTNLLLRTKEYNKQEMIRKKHINCLWVQMEKQHISVVTHHSGHTLDLVITQENDLVLNSTVKDSLISDHKVIQLSINIAVPRAEQKRMAYMKFKALDVESFAAGITNALEIEWNSDHTVDINTYNKVLTSTLDRHAPEKIRVITLRPHAHWCNDELRASKHERRRRQHKWRRSGPEIDKETYKEQQDIYNIIWNQTKSQYYSIIVTDQARNPKDLLQLVDLLIHGKETNPVLPEHTSLNQLSDRFATFFSEKFKTIRLNLSNRQTDSQLLIHQEAEPELVSSWMVFSSHH
ncbi:hypothetical protein CAPTEDRAFT_200593 [Capitella teleta]|uniref:Endonuclease/exonuclease/phosphatase domain-containing protein n=1 Tax=Capitella teleta TaxID=283909 RepID=R7TEJ8_CAPTE|nr:hypothetical protein CAPTEDRAFT_200593 [Capitella teleta]|eukprot:ELT89897.1 hypothetical protein CAPTEDRAFT_200593 [Capitella teleta]